MNCKPNQRAIVTRTILGQGVEYLGMVFTVRRMLGAALRKHSNGTLVKLHYWEVDPGHVHPAGTPDAGTPLEIAPDEALTPLPDDPDAPEQEVTDKEIEHA